MSIADKHILLIEDSDTQALKFTLFFEDEGWFVTRAATAEEGLEFLNQLMPDLIVVDYFLPGMHGDAFCRQVRMKAATRHVPVLMLTAADSSATEVQGLDSGADDYLPKSEDETILLLRIHSLFRKFSGQTTVPSDISFRQARILAVDDSPTYLTYLVEELQHEGYLVDQAESGEVALKKLEADDYDCVVVDLVMPGIDGIGVCQKLNQISQQKLNPILVLMLTAHDNHVELSRALAAGADDFVGKSSDISVLKGRVRALLRRKLSQDENQRLMKEIIQAKEQEALHARKAQEEAEARAALSGELAQALKKLQASKHELEQLAYISAHDLQEPLRLLTNYTQLLVHRLPAEVVPKNQRYLDFIAENTQRMQRQVQSLLAYLSASTEVLKLEPINLEILIAEVWEPLATHYPMAQLQVLSPLPALTASVYHLKLLYHHLFQNALQFVPSDRAPLLRLQVKEGENEWILSVQDNGVGIESLYFERIFQMFQHLSSEQKRRSSGMGLPICRKIAELHQGQIWLESEAGIGSTFFFSLAKDL